MNIKDLLKEDSIILESHSITKDDVINEMVNKHDECGHLNDKEKYKKAIYAREELSSTGVGHMIAIPHAQDDSVTIPSLVALVQKDGIDYQSLDGEPAKLFFMIAVPKEGGSQHLEILAQLCQILMDETVVDQLIDAHNPQDFINILCGEMDEEEKEEHIGLVDIVAVTACPTGVAHTYMAAQSLEDTAKEMGCSIKVETNGASGIKNKLTAEDIKSAKCVIVAADKNVEMDRFDGKRIIRVPVRKAIQDPKELINSALSEEDKMYKDETKKKHFILEYIYTPLMNGISQIIPIMMVYGIFAGIEYYLQKIGIYYDMSLITSVALTLALCILSGYIADSIGGRTAFAVAIIASGYSMSVNGYIIESILIGYLSGLLVYEITHLLEFLPENVQSLIPNLLSPIISLLLMVFLINAYSIYIMAYSHIVLTPMFIDIIIGIILGMMMSFDMGGPVNKVAYAIGIMSIFLGRYDIMSAVMISGMIPPLMIWLNMLLFKSFTEEERKRKWNCFWKGLCFVSEEAIPYMSKDKRGVHIPCMIASAIAGALVMCLGCGQAFPHGGIFTIFFITQPWMFILSLIIASFVGAVLIYIYKDKKAVTIE